VSLKERYLWLKDSGNVVKQYPIAIGAPESPTIPGIYNILKKVKDPNNADLKEEIEKDKEKLKH